MSHIILHIAEIVLIALLAYYLNDLAQIVLKLNEMIKDATGDLEAIKAVSRTFKAVAATVEQRYTGRSRAVKTEQEKDLDKEV